MHIDIGPSAPYWQQNSSSVAGVQRPLGRWQCMEKNWTASLDL